MTTPSALAAPPAEAAFRPHLRSGRSRLALAGVGWSLVNTLLGAGLSALGNVLVRV